MHLPNPVQKGNERYPFSSVLLYLVSATVCLPGAGLCLGIQIGVNKTGVPEMVMKDSQSSNRDK